MRTLKHGAAILLMTAFVSSPSTNAMMNIDTKGVGMAAAEVLRPLIEPLGEEIVKEAAKKLRVALDILSRKGLCKLNCVTLQKVTCNKLIFSKLGEWRTGACKQECQEMIEVGGGYTLKIRYTTEKDGSTWSLKTCVTTAKKAGVHEFNEDNVKSIAIYGEDQYNLAMKVIKQIAALDEFVLFAGRVPETKGKSQAEIDELLKDADAESKRLNKAFQDYVQLNFQPQ